MDNDPNVPETVPVTEEASNPAPVTSQDAVLAALANVTSALQSINTRLSAVEAGSTPVAATGPPPVAVTPRNVEPPDEPHPDHLNGVYHVLHTLISKAGFGENDSIALHNAIPNVNPPEAPPEAQAA